jgi:hypothetical protein
MLSFRIKSIVYAYWEKVAGEGQAFIPCLGPEVMGQVEWAWSVGSKGAESITLFLTLIVNAPLLHYRR